MALADRLAIKTALLNLLASSIASSFTADATMGSPVLTSPSSTAGLFLGMPVGSAVVPRSAYITALSPLTLSDQATADAAAATFTTGFAETGTRLKWYTELAAQPALFIRHAADEYPPRRTAREIPSAPTLEFEAWVYSNAGRDPDLAPGDALDNILDAMRIVMTPVPGLPQTLGLAIVQHAWIEGRVEYEPGDLAGQAIAVVPLRVLAPGL